MKLFGHMCVAIVFIFIIWTSGPVASLVFLSLLIPIEMFCVKQSRSEDKTYDCYTCKYCDTKSNERFISRDQCGRWLCKSCRNIDHWLNVMNKCDTHSTKRDGRYWELKERCKYYQKPPLYVKDKSALYVKNMAHVFKDNLCRSNDTRIVASIVCGYLSEYA